MGGAKKFDGGATILKTRHLLSVNHGLHVSHFNLHKDIERHFTFPVECSPSSCVLGTGYRENSIHELNDYLMLEF